MYKAPVGEILAALKAQGLDMALGRGAYAELTGDVVEAIVEEAGKFASDEVAPLGEIGDKQGSRLVDRRMEFAHRA